MKVLLTGGTGFIGSHVADALVESEYELIITKRKSSSFENIALISDKLHFVDTDSADWVAQVCLFAPSIIIHCAWNGVASEGRSNIMSQISNISFVNDLLFIADKCKVSKFIALGSQAEYGKLMAKVSEHSDSNPTNIYGLLKLCVFQQIESYCKRYEIDWFWLRIFSVFGERESQAWLLPQVVKKASCENEMNFTQGKQKYAYLYVKDLAKAILAVCEKENAKSGIYNISSCHAVEIQEILMYIIQKMNSQMKLNFGAIPYRDDQSMHIEGDSSKFIKEFGAFERTSLSEGLDRIIDFYTVNNEVI